MRATFLLTTFLLGMACIPTAIAAQQPANVPAAFAGDVSSRTTYTDVFIGRNTRGPFLLSWKGVRPQSERVVVDGHAFIRGQDYTIDYAAGTLVFVRPLRTNNMARVTYELDPKTAAANPKTLQLPLEMELLNAARGKLALTGSHFVSTAPTAKERTLLGLTGELLPSGATKVAATFLTDINAQGRVEDKSGMRLQASSKSELAEWTMNYLRTGRDFSEAKTWKVQPDTDAFSTSLKLLLSQRLSASIGYQQSEVGKANTSASSATLQFSPSEGIGAVVSYLSQDTPLANITATSAAVSISRGQLAVGIERRTQEQQSLLQGRSETNTDRVTAQVNVTPNTQARAVIEQQRLSAGQNDIEKSSAALDVVSSPSKPVQMRAGIRYGEVNDRQQTEINLGVSATPSPTYRLLGSFTQKSGEQIDRETATSLRMVTMPLPILQVETGATVQTLGEQASLRQDVMLALQPYRNVRLETGFQGSYADTSEGYVRTLRAQLAPNRTWQLEARHRLRLVDNPNLPSETWSVGLSLTPSPRLSITGNYTLNPEDNKGNIQRQEQAELRMQALLNPALSLQGSLGMRRDLLKDTRITLADVALVYRFSPLMELLTGYSINRQEASIDLASHTYRLAYRYALGGLFNISLEGRLVTYERDRLFQPNQTDYDARLRLGIKF